jgi:thermostable 8-oxoguanine DNA glycosylase
MIDPTNITNYNRTKEELEEFALFCPAVAGKTAKIQAEKLDRMLKNLEDRYGNDSPFKLVNRAASDDILEDEMRNVKLGKYSMLVPCYKALSFCDAEDLLDTSVYDLKRFPGWGNKTARFFLMHAKEDTNVATLNTHILSWMQENTDIDHVPDSTPSSNREYKRLEHYFLKECKDRGRDPTELDLEIWNQYS